MAKKAANRPSETNHGTKIGGETRNLDDLSRMHRLEDESRPGVRHIWPVKKVFSRKNLNEEAGTENPDAVRTASGGETDKTEASGPSAGAEDSRRQIALEDLSDEDFLAIYGDGSDTRTFGQKVKNVFRSVWRGITFPCRWYKEKINDRDMDAASSRYVMNIVGIVGGLTFILVLIVGGVLIYNIFTSYDSYFNQGQAYVAQGDPEHAAGAYEKAFQAARSGEEKAESAMALGDLYFNEHSDLNAAYYYERVVDVDHSNIPALTRLLQLYEQRNDLQAIIEVAKIAEGAEAKVLFSDYLLNQPVFNYKSGTYDEKIRVEITAGEAENIYYTLDDTEATEESTLYSGPIQLEEGKTVFHAIAVNRNGLMSEELVVTYEIVSDAPAQPVISPASGTYREPTKITVEIPDGCRAYYTFDGSEPTAQSEEYREPVDIPIGNNVFTVIFISQNGVQSKPASCVYDMIYSTQVTKSEALYSVRRALTDKGVLLDMQGTTADPNAGGASFYCDQVITINEQQYYRINCNYDNPDMPPVSYAVQVDSGVIFTLETDPSGNYTLTGF